MTNEEILSKVDHTLLKMTSSWEEIKTLCDEALLYKTASVCIPPSYVMPVHNVYEKLNICTVIGFPLGYSITAAKVLEAQRAILSGASEIDMVINVADVKNGKYDYVFEEIKLIKKECKEKILKVIIETCFLTEEEKVRMCKVVTEAGADFIKTSTGFGTAGATLADVELFKKNIGSNVKIKAAGGVKTRDDLQAFIQAGASRIGTSSAVKLLAQTEFAQTEFAGGCASGY
ncbi:MAG: deoxyribose-phosphate aldolase [Treponema sp.]|nr:deoxyribose-phosphate aldolase [Treponema sp.]MCL2250792.1 deoxyribose-phosphate aldolase [Treponema sp.]